LAPRGLNIENFPVFGFCITFLHYLLTESHEGKHRGRLVESHEEKHRGKHEESHGEKHEEKHEESHDEKHEGDFFYFFYFFIKCMQPMAMALSRRCVYAKLHVTWPKSLLYIFPLINHTDSLRI